MWSRTAGRWGAMLVLAATMLASPAWAAQVVEVRVGNHPTYTRVVFELDAPAGYRIERRGDGGHALRCGRECVIGDDIQSSQFSWLHGFFDSSPRAQNSRLGICWPMPLR